MTDVSPYRVQVMRIRDLKPPDEDEVADATSTSASSDVPQPAASAQAPSDAAPASTPAAAASVPEAVIIDEHVVSEAPKHVGFLERSIARAAKPQSAPAALMPESAIGAEDAKANDSRTSASMQFTVMPKAGDVPPRVSPTKNLNTDVAPASPTPEEPVVPTKVEAVTPATDSYREPIQEPASHTFPSAGLPTDEVRKPVADAPHSAGVNLSALRERVLADSTSPGFHAKVQSAIADPRVEGMAQIRKAKLAGTDLGLVHSTAHEPDTSGTAPNLNAVGASPSSPSITPTSTQERVRNILMQDGSRLNEPAAEHGQQIAQVAQNLRELHAAGVTPPPSMPDVHMRAPETSIPAMRTFRSDVEHTVMHNQTSVVSAITAEENRRNNLRGSGARTSLLTPGAYLFLGMSIMLLVFGLLGVGFYIFLSKDPTVLPKNEVRPLFFTENQEEFNITDKDRSDIMNRLLIVKDQVDVQVGAITHVYFTKAASSLEGSPVKVVTGQEFLKVIEVRAPNNLVRSLEPDMMFGINEYEGNQPFLIFTTNSFQHTFAGMLEWERDINLDLAPLFGEIIPFEDTQAARETDSSVRPVTPDTTTTGSSSLPLVSTSTLVTPGLNAFGFQDDVYNNKQVRVLKNAEGKVILLWAFIDPSYIVITTNRRTFEEVVTRIGTRRF